MSQQSHSDTTPLQIIEVLTESSLISEPSPSSSPQVDNSSFAPIEAKSLIDLYDSTFENTQQYDEFRQLQMNEWKNALKFKYFDHLYTSHRTTQQSVTQLRQQAQSLLEEADKLQKHHDKYIQDLHHFLPTITRRELRIKLSRPVKTLSKKSSTSSTKPNTLHLPKNTSIQTQSPVSSSSAQPPPYQTRRQRGTMGKQYTCFQCGSPDHFKWNCTKYRCYYCRKLSPGHSQRQCPENNTIPDDDHYDDMIENEGVEQY